mmetsp:Transcript_20044/g.41727  ORF Transcript_20044/g.41727 Transcript_20044/m.41727 type:complete len:484 (+) Transcript_20044:222-1673(+)
MKNSSQAKSKALFILTLAIFIASASFYFNNPETISHSTEEPELVYRALSHHDAKSESFTPVKNEELSRFRLSLEEARSQGGGLIHGRFSSKVPYHNRWRNRFNAVKARNGSGGIFFFRHIRKAGGTSLREVFRQVMEYHNQEFDVGFTVNTTAPQETVDPDKPKILYVEEEFHPISWDCPVEDPRWEDTLSVTVLRRPIERHMSEFFYYGPGKDFGLDREKLFVDEEYTALLAQFLAVKFPRWMKWTDSAKSNSNYEDWSFAEKFRAPFFYRHYTDNFQLRSFAGCSSRECVDATAMKGKVSEEELEYMEEMMKGKIESYDVPDWACSGGDNPRGYCTRHTRDKCPHGCEGPCMYPSLSFGELTEYDLERAKKALERFDVVLITETFDQRDQKAFLADVLSSPRGFSIGNVNSNLSKKDEENKNSFYGRLLRSLAPEAYEMLEKENEFEIALYRHAVWLNHEQTWRWKKEVGWEDQDTVTSLK